MRVPIIFLKRWKGNRILLTKNDKNKPGISFLRSRTDWSWFFGFRSYCFGLTLWFPERLRQLKLKVAWSEPGMFLSDSYDSLRFRYKAWKYGGE